MAARRKTEPDPNESRRPPAKTPEGRENQMISAAIDLAERRIREGTASAQEIVHFLKLGSSREKLEQERLTRENELLSAKVVSIQSAARSEELFDKAIKAMRSYQGDPVPEDNDGFD